MAQLMILTEIIANTSKDFTWTSFFKLVDKINIECSDLSDEEFEKNLLNIQFENLDPNIRLMAILGLGLNLLKNYRNVSKTLELNKYELDFMHKNKDSPLIDGICHSLFLNPLISKKSKQYLAQKNSINLSTNLEKLLSLNSSHYSFPGGYRFYQQNFKENPKKFSELSFFKRPPHYISSNPLITISLAHHNDLENLLNISIPSLLNQSEKRFRCFVFDDNSVGIDKWIKLRNIFKNDNRFIFLKNKKKLGPYLIRNFALKNADTKYFTVCDSDDYQMEYRFEKQLEEIKGNLGIINSWIKCKENGEFLVREDGYIACMATNSFFHETELRNTIGYYFNLKFGSDSEYLDRSKLVFKNKIIESKIIVTLGLDSEKNLSKNGKAERIEFKDSYQNWHKLSKKLFVGLENQPNIGIPQNLVIPSKAYRYG